MNVLSLFDGMSCGQIALNRVGIKYDTYYASEIDKHAIKVTQHNYPDTVQLGDVTRWREWDIDWAKIGLVLAGSPCQGFSFAGKQLAFDDPRSALFFVFVEIWNHVKKHNPDAKFLLENVKMKKEHELVISNYMGIAPIEINSALVSAQNRQRLYWSNISAEPYGLFGDMRCTIPQPKDKGILLRDILETDVPEKYYLSEKMLKYFENRAANFNQGKVNIRDEDGKASTLTSSSASCDISDNFIFSNPDKKICLDANYHKGTSLENYLEKSRRQLVVDDSVIVASRGRNSENPKIQESSILTPKRTEYGKQIRKDYEAGNIKTQRKNIQQLEPRTDGKTNCLTSVQKDNLVMLNERQKANHKNEDEKANTFLSTSWKGSQANGMTLVGTTKIRRLTPTECERLQTVEDGYTSCVSDTQRYRMLGNGWTIDVIAHILSYMKPKP